MRRQGGLDLRYIAERYAKGQTWVEKFLGAHHQYIQPDNGFLDLHADLLRFMSNQNDGGDSLLDGQV